eukprot:g3953.t1
MAAAGPYDVSLTLKTTNDTEVEMTTGGDDDDQASAKSPATTTTTTTTRATTSLGGFSVGSVVTCMIAGEWDKRPGVVTKIHMEDQTLDVEIRDVISKIPLKGKTLAEVRASDIDPRALDDPVAMALELRGGGGRGRGTGGVRYGFGDRAKFACLLLVGLALLVPGAVLLGLSNNCAARDAAVGPTPVGADRTQTPERYQGCRVSGVYKCNTGPVGAFATQTTDTNCGGRYSGKAWQCTIDDLECVDHLLVKFRPEDHGAKPAQITLSPQVSPIGTQFCKGPEEDVQAFCQKQWPANTETQVWQYANPGYGWTLGTVTWALALQHEPMNGGYIGMIVFGALVTFLATCMAGLRACR